MSLRPVKPMLGLLVSLAAACQSPSAHQEPESAPDPAAAPAGLVALPAPPPADATLAPTLAADTSLPEVSDTSPEDWANYFLVIADTGQNYYALRNQLLRLAPRIGVPIDTMGRTFNVGKNRITLPEDDEDEMYAGDYYPRRTPSRSLSLEYLDVYQRQAGPQTIALVAGIYEQAASADSALTTLKPLVPRAFRLDARVYAGCLH